VLARLGFGAP